MNPSKKTTTTIKKMVNGGYGICHDPDGTIILVRFGLPAETVEITHTTYQKVQRGEVSTVLKEHPGRIQPPCPYYRSCGGCNLQHADYHTQCSLKDHILKDLFERSPSTEVRQLLHLLKPIIKSPSPYGYRQRIRLKNDGSHRLGFTRYRSHEIVPIQRCLLAPDIINECLTSLLNAHIFPTLVKNIDEVEILQDPDKMRTFLILHLSRKVRAQDRKNANHLAAELGSHTLLYLAGKNFAQEGPFGLDDKSNHFLSLSLNKPGPVTLFWEAGGFCQVNLEQNQRLIRLVFEIGEMKPTDSILDLYCGMGNFSIPFAQTVKQVLGIESQGSAIRSGRRNCEFNGINNVAFIKSDVIQGCRRLADNKRQFDTIICDPPRQGIPGAATLLSNLCRKNLIYVSCDPATLCRDLAALLGEGFNVLNIQPLDMFPQTHHIETITLLEKITS